jgi:hypothetical protein
VCGEEGVCGVVGPGCCVEAEGGGGSLVAPYEDEFTADGAEAGDAGVGVPL